MKHTNLILSVLIVLLSTSLVACGSQSSPELETEVSNLEAQYSVVLNTEMMSDEEKVSLAESFLAGGFSYTYATYADPSVQYTPGAGTVYVPSIALAPDQLNQLIKFMHEQKAMGGYSPVQLHYVVTHWTNHMRLAGINPTDVGRAGSYLHQIINQAANGNGVMFYRPASSMYQEAYFVASKIDGKIWGAWLDSLGRPITAYLQNQKSIDAVNAKYVSDGFVRLGSKQDLSPEIIKNWLTTVPPTLRFYFWGIQKMSETTTLQVAIQGQQTLESLSTAALRLGPPVPIFISPCYLSPNLAGCGTEETDI